MMKIANVRTHVLSAELSQPFAYSRAWVDKRMATIVEIETDNGLVGWGECYGPAWITAAVVRSVSPWLRGEDPLRSDWLWHEIYARLRDHGQKGVVIQGLSGIDIALWDIKGKHFGCSVHRLMGGPLRTEVRAYATGLYRRKSGDPIRYLADDTPGGSFPSVPQALSNWPWVRLRAPLRSAPLSWVPLRLAPLK